MNIMLSEKMQRKLTMVRAFTVLDRAPMYSADSGMREIEQALSGSGLLVPKAFGGEWRAYAAQLMDAAEAGKGTREEYELLAGMMAGG